MSLSFMRMLLKPGKPKRRRTLAPLRKVVSISGKQSEKLTQTICATHLESCASLGLFCEARERRSVAPAARRAGVASGVIVRAVAKGRSLGALAAAQIHGFGTLRLEGQRPLIGPRMGAVAKGLPFRFRAGAPEIHLTGLDIDGVRTRIQTFAGHAILPLSFAND
jgi:hypothetical protein